MIINFFLISKQKRHQQLIYNFNYIIIRNEETENIIKFITFSVKVCWGNVILIPYTSHNLP